MWIIIAYYKVYLVLQSANTIKDQRNKNWQMKNHLLNIGSLLIFKQYIGTLFQDQGCGSWVTVLRCSESETHNLVLSPQAWIIQLTGRARPSYVFSSSSLWNNCQIMFQFLLKVSTLLSLMISLAKLAV